MAAGDLDRAHDVLQGVVKHYAGWAPAEAQLGTLHLSRGEAAAARRAYSRALEAQPDLLEALAGLVAIDVSEHRAEAGLARVEARLARAPRDVALLLLAARTHVATGEPARAETALRTVIDIDPAALQAYTMLAELYFRTGRLDEARQEFERLLARQPDSVAAHTMVGIILHAQGKEDDARQRYERALALDSHAAVAANNLAWLYAEGHGSLDAALSLAQTAKARLPEQPEVNDTLGWIYYRKGLASLAVPLLKTSMDRDPENPIYQYHLGLAQAGAGNVAAARTTLALALNRRPDLDASGEAKRVLAGR
jgi:tetratricopeptide (TPR) repeat protein